jgi:hypothetical protein
MTRLFYPMSLVPGVWELQVHTFYRFRQICTFHSLSRLSPHRSAIYRQEHLGMFIGWVWTNLSPKYSSGARSTTRTGLRLGISHNHPAASLREQPLTSVPS